MVPLTSNMVNGIDVEQLLETMKAVRDDPKVGQCRFMARHQWISGPQAKTMIEEYQVGGEKCPHREQFVFQSDEPRELLGDDLAPNATEAVLHALASCLDATLIYHASLKRIPVHEVELHLEGNLDLRGFLGISPEVRNGFSGIQVTCHIKADAPREKLQELCQLAQQHSPVFDIVNHGVPVSVKLA